MTDRNGPSLAALLLLAALALSFAVPSPAASGGTYVILDASGSMWGQIDGKAKIVVAKEVLSGLLANYPDGSPLGLAVYGHRRKGDCGDIEELAPFGQTDRQALIASVNSLNARGMTPLTSSILFAAERLKAVEEAVTVVLISDGRETCRGNPVEAAAHLRAKGHRFTLHVIGFDVSDEEQRQLEAIAQAGGGRYFNAADAAQFRSAAEEATATTSKTDRGWLRLKAYRNGELFQAPLTVTGEGEPPFQGLSVVAADDPGLLLPPGVYRVTVSDGGSPAQTKDLDLTVTGDKTAEAAVAFEASALKVSVLGDGGPRGATIAVLLKGKTVAEAHTYGDNPVTFPVPAGTYDVVVTDGAVEPPAIRPFEGVVIEPGKTTDLTATFVGGTLQVSALADGRPTQAWIAVIAPEKGDEIAGVRFHRDEAKDPANGRLFLQPGTYDIRIEAEEIDGEPFVAFSGVAIEAGKTTDLEADFSSGILEVTALEGGRPAQAWIAVRKSGKSDDIAGARLHAEEGEQRVSFTLQPGSYDVVVTYETVASNPVRTASATVEAGKSLSLETELSAASALAVRVTVNGEPSTSWVSVRTPEEDEEITGARIHADEGEEGVSFSLEGGSYAVVATAEEIDGSPMRRMGAELDEGGKVELLAAFEAGTLSVTLPENLIQAWISVIDGEGNEIAGCRLGGEEPRQGSFRLAVGSYTVVVHPEGQEEADLLEWTDQVIEKGTVTTVPPAL